MRDVDLIYYCHYFMKVNKERKNTNMTIEKWQRT